MDLVLPALLLFAPATLTAISMALMFAVLMTAIFFLVSAFFQSPQLSATAKEELSALILTGMIILFWFSFDIVLNNVVNGLLVASLPPEMAADAVASCIAEDGSDCSGGLGTSHIDLAYGCLEILFVKLKDIYVDLYLFEVLIGFLSTLSFPIGSPVPAVNVISFTLMPFTGLVLLSNAHTVVVEAIGYMMSVIWAKQFVILFCKDVIPLILLPFGLLLRAFPWFRITGSSVIALCFAGYFVLPFSILLTNYLVFDLYQPADFAYAPDAATLFSGRTNAGDDVTGREVTDALHEAREGDHMDHLTDLFSSRPASEQAMVGSECEGNLYRRLSCGAVNLWRGAEEIVTGLGSTIWGIWTFMVGMSGDFIWTLFNNPLMPASVSAGLYYFIINEVITLSQFLIVLIVASVLEIIITVTMYRNIALIIGGEPDIAGLTKII